MVCSQNFCLITMLFLLQKHNYTSLSKVITLSLEFCWSLHCVQRKNLSVAPILNRLSPPWVVQTASIRRLELRRRPLTKRGEGWRRELLCCLDENERWGGRRKGMEKIPACPTTTRGCYFLFFFSLETNFEPCGDSNYSAVSPLG